MLKVENIILVSEMLKEKLEFLIRLYQIVLMENADMLMDTISSLFEIFNPLSRGSIISHKWGPVNPTPFTR